MEEKQDFLKSERMSKLIFKFSLPCVISMVVAALYNIVDQIYIGHSLASEAGNAATNIVYPFTLFALGFALLIGDGSCSNFSVCLGRKDHKNANNYIGLSIILLVIISLIITTLGLVFENKILNIFGAKEEIIDTYKYAKDYYHVICLGIPFYVIGQGLNGIIRADGSPKYAMSTTLIGAISNIILDPIFIFSFNLEVLGAAIATVIGEIITFILSFVYLFKGKNFKLNKEAFKIDFRNIKNIISIGFASLIVQLSIVIIATLNNNLFGKYGPLTLASSGIAYGATTPLAVVGIVLKVFGIVISIVIGISLGGQPIIGYNIGSKNYKQVKKCVSYITVLVSIVGFIALLIFEFFPNGIIAIFGKDNSYEYLEFFRLCTRIFLSGIILTCYIKSSSIILQAMGKSIKSTIIALARDVIFFVPTSIIIASVTHNIVSLLWSALISDILGAIVAFILVNHEIKKLK